MRLPGIMRSASIGLFLVATFFCKASLAKTLGVQKIPQKTETWCWAAATEMVLRFHGVNTGNIVSQCNQVSRVTGVNCCVPLCPSGEVPDDCLIEGWPDFSFPRFDAKCKNGFLDWDEIDDEINNQGRPIIGTWLYVRNRVSHTMVIRGAQVSAGFRVLDVIDPEKKCKGKFLDPMPYEAYKRIPQHHRQWYNFYKIKQGQGDVDGCPRPGSRLATDTPPITTEELDEVVEARASNEFASADEAATGSWQRIVEASKKGDSVWGGLNLANIDPNIGIPLDEYFVDSQDLKTYQGLNPALALNPTGQRIYPIEVNGVAVASITVFRDGDVWRLGSFSPGLIGARKSEDPLDEPFQLFRLRRDMMTKGEGRLEDFGRIEIPESGDSFLALIESSKLYFVPVAEDPILGLKPGVKQMGDVVLRRIEINVK